MRTKEEINAEYSKVCQEIGSFEWAKAQLLNRVVELNDELLEVGRAETEKEKTSGKAAAKRKKA